jgi:formylmethanofuran dehydrogenase subunit D
MIYLLSAYKIFVMNPSLKLALILSAVFIFAQCKKEQSDIVHIPDNNFLNVLIQKGIDSDGNGKISSE